MNVQQIIKPKFSELKKQRLPRKVKKIFNEPC
jgi:hypothetical protein